MKPAHYVLTAAVFLCSATSAKAEDWRSCPSIGQKYEVIEIYHHPTDDEFVKLSNERYIKLDNWCGASIHGVSDVFPTSGDVSRAIFRRCLSENGDRVTTKAMDANFPNDPDIIYCGPGKKAPASASPPAKKPDAATKKPDPPATCSARDIEGNWKRGDGASIVLNGMNLKDGGRALMFNNPSGWPAGVFKFSGIKQNSGCEFQAVCQTVHRNSAGGGYNTSKASCTLVLDKQAGTLKAPGSHGSYRR